MRNICVATLSAVLLAAGPSVDAQEVGTPSTRGTALKPSGDPVFFWEEDRAAMQRQRPASVAPVPVPSPVYQAPVARVTVAPASPIASRPAVGPSTPAAGTDPARRCEDDDVLTTGECPDWWSQNLGATAVQRFADNDRDGGSDGGSDGGTGGGSDGGSGGGGSGGSGGGSGGGSSGGSGGDGSGGSGSGGGGASAGPGGADAGSGSSGSGGGGASAGPGGASAGGSSGGTGGASAGPGGASAGGGGGASGDGK